MAARRVGFGSGRQAAGTTDAESEGRRSKSVAAIFLMIPLGFALLGAWLLVDAIAFVSAALPSKGEVIAVETKADSDGVTYVPTIRYTARDGASHEAVTHIAASGYDYRIGAGVDILYDPAEPEEVRIDDPLSLWALPVGLTLLGSILSIIVLGAMLRAARANAS
jgi:hypothetical protein